MKRISPPEKTKAKKTEPKPFSPVRPAFDPDNPAKDPERPAHGQKDSIGMDEIADPDQRLPEAEQPKRVKSKVSAPKPLTEKRPNSRYRGHVTTEDKRNT